MIKIYVFLFFYSILTFTSYASIGDTLTLESAIIKAKKNYPLTRQKGLLDKIASLTFKNISTALYPQLNLVAQASYQSAVTQIPFSLPGFTIVPLSKDQYKVILDLNQMVYDGGQTKAQKNMIIQQNIVDQQKLEVEYEKLEQKLIDLWFSILLLQEQEHILAVIQNDIDNLITRLQSQVENGTSLKSSLYNIQSEKLHNEQRLTDLYFNKKALIDVLSLFMIEKINYNVHFLEPEVSKRGSVISKYREERILYSYQRELVERQIRVLNSKINPRLNLFMQGGYGKPGINLLKNEFDFYYIGGIRLNWNFGNFYTYRKDKQISMNQIDMLNVQEDMFLLQSEVELKRQDADIERIQILMNTDEKIIELKSKVMFASKAQLENGVITSGDYIRDQNAEEQARLSKLLHRLQLKQTILNHNLSTAE